MADGSVRTGPDVNAPVDAVATDALRTCDDCDQTIRPESNAAARCDEMT